jgi:protein-S-isoprenylcysteine O-methyltransferase Ste14
MESSNEPTLRAPPLAAAAATFRQSSERSPRGWSAGGLWRSLHALQTAASLSRLISGRRANALLFAVTLVELVVLFRLTPAFTLVDWIYLSQNVLVLAIALTRRDAVAQDKSWAASLAVVISYAYPYAQVIYLNSMDGYVAWPAGGLVLVTLAAFLSLAALLSIGRLFGVRPALRGLATNGPYRLVRHPMYLAYVIADIGYQLQEWNVGTVLIVAAGWAALAYRIHAEERMLALHSGWAAYIGRARYRLVPKLW